MKRIEACLNKLVEKKKMKIKREKIETALKSGELNAQEAYTDAELKLQSTMERIADTDDIKNVIIEMSSIMDSMAEAEQTLARLKKLREYLEEEVEVVEPEK